MASLLLKNSLALQFSRQSSIEFVGLTFCFLFSGSPDTSGNHPVRLVGGTADNEGRVEIYSGGKWGAVGDKNWGMVDADVVCKELGFPYALETVRHLLAGNIEVCVSFVFHASLITLKNRLNH